MRPWILGLVISSIAIPAFAADRPQVIYGDDNRRDIFDPGNTDFQKTLAESTAALVFSATLTEDENNPDIFKLPTESFGESYDLCKDEPFYEQPNPAFCSGFLVAPNIMVTAGHCIETAEDCGGISFVFDLGYKTERTDLSTVPKSNVYSCKTLIAQELEGLRGNDFAVVELDREVTDRAPLNYRTRGTIQNGTDILVVGHPAGLPTKIADGAAVRDNVDLNYFVANLDTYGGNSGSAVFNAETGVVEGILVRGEQDFFTRVVEEDSDDEGAEEGKTTKDDNGGEGDEGDDDGEEVLQPPKTCLASYKCTDTGCRGEDVTKATNFAQFVPNHMEQPDAPSILHEIEKENIGLAIPDNNEDGVTYEFDVQETGAIGVLGIHIMIDHEYTSDLSITLIHPDGTAILLRDIEIVDDQMDIDANYGWGGLPVEDLAKLKEKELKGTWKIHLTDTNENVQGSLTYVKLTAKTYAN